MLFPRLECPFPLRKYESVKEEKWIPSSRPRIVSPLQWRVCWLPAGRVIRFLLCLCHAPHIAVLWCILYWQGFPSNLIPFGCSPYHKQCCHPPTGARILRGSFQTSPCPTVFFLNCLSWPSISLHVWCHSLLSNSHYISCLYYLNSLLSFSQILLLLSQHSILDTAARVLL